MSFEGYNQSLCENGHLTEVDVYYEDEPCQYCGKPTAWRNIVSQTNGDDYGHIDMARFLVARDEIALCNLGHYHVTRPAVYRIPTEAETLAARTYIREDGIACYVTTDEAAS